jgi:protein TonB
MSVMIALVAGSAVACHYKAEDQYVNDKDVPGADSGTRRISTTTMRSDSTNMPTNAAAASGMTAPVTKPAGSAAASNSSSRALTSKPVARAKFAHGRATVTMPKIYGAADVAPQFPGGERGLDNYINKTVNYPQQAIDDDVSGTVHVSFIVDEKGHVTKARVMGAANISDGLDQEALRVVKNMPAWMPGTVKGKKVKTRMELPISFQVES